MLVSTVTDFVLQRYWKGLRSSRHRNPLPLRSPRILKTRQGGGYAPLPRLGNCLGDHRGSGHQNTGATPLKDKDMFDSPEEKDVGIGDYTPAIVAHCPGIGRRSQQGTNKCK